jgi:hypothetical protein
MLYNQTEVLSLKTYKLNFSILSNIVLKVELIPRIHGFGTNEVLSRAIG